MVVKNQLMFISYIIVINGKAGKNHLVGKDGFPGVLAGGCV